MCLSVLKVLAYGSSLQCIYSLVLGRFVAILGEGTSPSPFKQISPYPNISFLLLLFKTEIKNEGGKFKLPPPQVPLQAYPLVKYNV